LGLFRADSDVLFVVVHLLPKGSGRLIFVAGSDDPFQVCHEAALGQREVCHSFDFTSLKQNKVHRSGIQQLGWLVDHLDALPPLKVLE
jgi:hypothetical protein